MKTKEVQHTYSPEVEQFIKFSPFSAPEVQEYRARRDKVRKEIESSGPRANEASKAAHAAALRVIEAEIAGKPEKTLKPLRTEADRLTKEATEAHARLRSLPGFAEAGEDLSAKLASEAAEEAMAKVRSTVIDTQSKLVFHAREVAKLNRELLSVAAKCERIHGAFIGTGHSGPRPAFELTFLNGMVQNQIERMIEKLDGTEK